MMGLAPRDVDRLTYWQFTALRHEWNERHKSDDPDGDPVVAPTVDHVRASQADLLARGIAGSA